MQCEPPAKLLFQTKEQNLQLKRKKLVFVGLPSSSKRHLVHFHCWKPHSEKQALSAFFSRLFKVQAEESHRPGPLGIPRANQSWGVSFLMGPPFGCFFEGDPKGKPPCWKSPLKERRSLCLSKDPTEDHKPAPDSQWRLCQPKLLKSLRCHEHSSSPSTADLVINFESRIWKPYSSTKHSLLIQRTGLLFTINPSDLPIHLRCMQHHKPQNSIARRSSLFASWGKPGVAGFPLPKFPLQRLINVPVNSTEAATFEGAKRGNV